MTKSERDQMVKSNQGLVIFIAKKWRTGRLEFLDLVQEGNIGLLHAIDNFDPEKGKFSTYACYWIKKYIRTAVGENRNVQIPEHVRLKIQAQKRKAAKIATLWGYEIQVDEYLECPYSEDVLFLPKKSDGIGGDLLFQERILANDLDMKKDLLKAFETLTWTEAIVVRQRLEGFTLEECGQQLHLTAQRASQLELLAREKMKVSYETSSPE